MQFLPYPSDKGGKRSYCESDNKYKKSHNLTETKGNFNEFFSEDFGKKENELDDSFFGKSLTDLVIPGDIPDINLFMVSENELSLEDYEKESTSPRRIPCERKKDNESDDLIFSKSLADLVIPGDVPNDLLMACNIEFSWRNEKKAKVLGGSYRSVE
ncbi:hypothetical protein VNO78_21389 [Psophocarpus tetragonolobus]|uniref:Uncharacterized protein n=1 Tax=Psophocarpus tetragonolobus TaxID=3891 RepID=A0AAN9SCR6_PSOTE